MGWVFCYRKGSDSKKESNSKKGSDSEKGAIVKKGAITKKMRMAKKEGIARKFCFHSKTVLLVYFNLLVVEPYQNILKIKRMYII